MLEKVISGGQTGADQAGWRAAKASGIATGGWMPKGFLTLDGPRPEFAEMYGAREHSSSDWAPRTRENIDDSDATWIFTESETSRGTLLATSYAEKVGRPVMLTIVKRGVIVPGRPAKVLDWLERERVKVLNIAGNRESKPPWIGGWVEGYLFEFFELLKGRGLLLAGESNG
ncbi:YpsA SLOG family protein [Singulisphaera sp. PoT]|uniref:YpsA SLOG family protein n=1 Tax=Singulisphaera sp. PoT TaxID=3411797 RepID=UPI003BF515AB